MWKDSYDQIRAEKEERDYVFHIVSHKFSNQTISPEQHNKDKDNNNNIRLRSLFLSISIG